MTRVVGGVDGGGSRTRVGFFDLEMTSLGRAEGPASAIHPGDPDASAETVVAGVREAAAEAGIGLPLAALHVGLAGAGRPGPREAVWKRLESAGLARIVTMGSDAEAAFHDAFSAGPGVLVVAGTGSMVLGRAGTGSMDRVGGWGPLVGDEGSGYALGRSALRAVARAEDGRAPPTSLRAAVLAATGCSRARDLGAWAVMAGRAGVASLAEAVALAGEAGDPTAKALLDGAARELMGQVQVLIDRLGPWSEPVPVALVGGLVAPGRPLRARMERALTARPVALRERLVDPVRGAASMARESVLQG